MNLKQNALRLIVLTLSVAAVGIATCSAQSIRGTFNLPEQTQLGQVVLQPGMYTLTLTRFQGGQREVMIRSDHAGSTAAIILPQSEGPAAVFTKTELVCFREGGTLVVHALEVAPLGEAIYFHMPQGAPLYAMSHGARGEAISAARPVT